MKARKNILIYILVMGFVTFSCQESFLDETPQDFYSADNAYVTPADFNAAVNKLYDNVRHEFYTNGEDQPYDFMYGTDLAHSGEFNSSARFENYAIQLDPTATTPLVHWNNLYKTIANTNTILGRLGASKLTDDQKKVVEAQAKFFRAFAYRTLAYLYGGVPLQLEEVRSPKTDFIRATKDEVYDQCIADLMFAAANLPGITAVKDGEISNAAANHLLAEVYLAAGEFTNAVTAATAVIGNPDMTLMTARFGSEKDNPGDVYWDLFRIKNQNRSSGNKESIWVIQFELDIPGGGMSSTSRSGYVLERHHAPLARDIKRNDNAAVKANFQWPTSDFTGGRGIGWMIPTYYFTNTIWASDFDNDMRNSEYNFPRKFLFNNPGVAEFQGVEFDAETNPEAVASLASTGRWPRNIYPYQSKCTTPGKHPTALFQNVTARLLTGNAGVTYTDQYMFRLAETYLIRAEAHLGAGNTQAAADDINIVRSRANASSVDPANVDIDYILDERMRELGVEEKRRLTLSRLGLVYARTAAHNSYNADDIQPFHNLFPIPYSEIERNTNSDLGQNSGYNGQ